MKLLDPSAGRIVAYLDSFSLSGVLRDRQARLASLRAKRVSGLDRTFGGEL